MSRVFKTALIKVVFYCSQYIFDASIIFSIWLFILSNLLTCNWNFFDIWKSLKIAFKRKDNIQKSFDAQFFFFFKSKIENITESKVSLNKINSLHSKLHNIENKLEKTKINIQITNRHFDLSFNQISYNTYKTSLILLLNLNAFRFWLFLLLKYYFRLRF